MSEKHKFIIARYSIKGKKFEILVYPEEAWNYRLGKLKDISKVLVYAEIYKDAKKGLRASEEDLLMVFGTKDVYEIADYIIKKGELPLTAEQRRRLIEEKKRQIITFISRNCIDPRTGRPIPPTRIESAMKEARVAIDPFKPADEQALQIIKALRKVLPLKMAKALVAVKIPAKYVGKAYGAIIRMGEVKREAWLPDGTWIAEIEIPAGLQLDLTEKVARLTKGEGQVRILSSR